MPCAVSSPIATPTASRASRCSRRDRHELGVTRFPTLVISTAGAGRPRPVVVGALPWAQVESFVLSALALPDAQPARAPTVAVALEAYGSGTTLEFATLLDLPSPETESRLDAARARRRNVGSSHYWTAEPGVPS